MKVQAEIEIARHPEVVFDFLVDTDSFPIVDRALVSYTPEGRMHVGLRGTFVHRRLLESTLEADGGAGSSRD